MTMQQSKITASVSVLRSHTRTIYTAGRPPWYNSAGQQVEPFVIGQLDLYLTPCAFAYFVLILNCLV